MMKYYLCLHISLGYFGGRGEKCVDKGVCTAFCIHRGFKIVVKQKNYLQFSWLFGFLINLLPVIMNERNFFPLMYPNAYQIL